MKNTNQKVLILTCGLPQAGKTTKALELGFPIVSPDALRLAIHGRHYVPEAEGLVWCLARYMVTALFEAGHDTVILDACNTKKARRDQWQSKIWETKFFIIDTTADECRCRAQTVEDPDLRNNLVASIDRMAREYNPVTEREGEIL